MKKLQKDRILGIIALAIALIAGIGASRIPPPIYEGDPGSAVIPYFGVFILVVCGIVLLIKPDKSEPRKYLTKEEWKRAFVIFAIYVLYFILLWILGFVPTIPIITFVLTFVLTGAGNEKVPVGKRIIKSLIFAVIASAVIIAIYKYGLRAALPRGMITKWFK